MGHAYCLMSNHYHLLMETPDANYAATTGDAACPDWLARDWLLSAFGSTEAAAVAQYRRFVAEGIGQPGPWEQLKQHSRGRRGKKQDLTLLEITSSVADPF